MPGLNSPGSVQDHWESRFKVDYQVPCQESWHNPPAASRCLVLILPELLDAFDSVNHCIFSHYLGVHSGFRSKVSFQLLLQLAPKDQCWGCCTSYIAVLAMQTTFSCSCCCFPCSRGCNLARGRMCPCNNHEKVPKKRKFSMNIFICLHL